MTKPIKPEDVAAIRCANIPSWVIKAVNELIVKNWSGTSAIIKQSEIKDQYLGEGRFDFSWLDFEPLFREAGWTVKYDKPAYYESYEAFFVFSK